MLYDKKRRTRLDLCADVFCPTDVQERKKLIFCDLRFVVNNCLFRSWMTKIECIARNLKVEELASRSHRKISLFVPLCLPVERIKHATTLSCISQPSSHFLKHKAANGRNVGGTALDGEPLLGQLSVRDLQYFVREQTARGPAGDRLNTIGHVRRKKITTTSRSGSQQHDSKLSQTQSVGHLPPNMPDPVHHLHT